MAFTSRKSDTNAKQKQIDVKGMSNEMNVQKDASLCVLVSTIRTLSSHAT